MSDHDEANSIGGRVKRYAKVSTAIGGLAARYAGKRYLGIAPGKTQYAEELKIALGGLKGPMMKVAQIIATIPDALPQDYADELRQLQANAPSMGWPFVKRRMVGELGPGWQKKFQSFEKEAVAAASLGQVHRAVGSDGTAFACKLQYPDMSSAVEADLKQLKLVFSIYERYDRAISTDQIHMELSARLREELDYAREAKHMRLYSAMLEEQANVHVPAPIDPLSTDRLLTMTWLSGAPILQFIEDHPDQDIRNQLAQNMFNAWYVPFYDYGIIHGDPHLGNYTVREDASVNLLDFGCIRIFPPTFVKGVIDLYRALRDDDEDLAVEAYKIWGFNDPSRALIDILNIWARFIYAPLMEDRVRRIHETDTGVYGRGVAAKVHEELGKLNGVRPPREFVLMDRAAIGLGSVFMHLRAEVNWHQMFHGLIDRFDPATLEANQKQAMAKVDLDEPD